MRFLRQGLTLRDSPHHLRMLGFFVLTSFIAIFSVAVIVSTALARYMTDKMMLRDAAVSSEFLNSIVVVEDAFDYFIGSTQDELLPEMEEFFVHVSRLPDVFRANVYSQSGEIIWSSDPQLIGQTFEGNEELDAAMHGEVYPERNVVKRGDKEEHVGFPEEVTEFIELYIPIWSRDRSQVRGAVEVYKAPASLLQTIHEAQRLCWLGAMLAGTILFGALLIVVAYTTRILQRQEARIIETERLAVVGEMASAVAHGLRNPLAAIRSCAELVIDDDISETTRGTVQDIVDQVDRLEGWIRSFLIRSRKEPGGAAEYAQIEMVVQKCIENFQPQLAKGGIRVELAKSDGSAVVVARGAELEQVLNSVISNGIEAMDTGGVLGIGWHGVPGGKIAIQVTDSGPGIAAEMLERMFQPFETGKASGLGVGLALGRRIAERMGGSLDVRNRSSAGVEVTLTIPGQA